MHGIFQTRILELLFLSPGDLPDSGIKPASLMSPPLAGEFFTTSSTWEKSHILLDRLPSVIEEQRLSA